MKRSFAWWLGAGAVAIGCSDDPGPPFPDELSFCVAKAVEECVVAPKCASREEDCRFARRNACEEAGLAARADGIRQYRPENAQACIDWTRETYAKDTLLPSDSAALDDVCLRVWRGAVPKFQPCKSTFECADGLVCDKGRCGELAQHSVGQPCANPGESCDASSICTLRDGVYQCDAKVPRGGECSPEGPPCQPGLRCAGTCQDRLGSGETCASNDDCAAIAPFCDPYVNNKGGAGLRFGPGYGACKLFGAE